MNEKDIKYFIRGNVFGRQIHCYRVLSSTNIKARELLYQEEGTIIAADEQTAGRGRMGRSWLSPPGQNLTFSVILRSKIEPQHIGLVSLCASVSVAEMIHETIGILPECKWPNDVLIGGKKVCGILSESFLNPADPSGIVVGIGLNVNQTEFHPEISGRATSLVLHAGKELDRNKVLADVLFYFENNYFCLLNGNRASVIIKWEGYSTILGKEIVINDGKETYKGRAESLDPGGGLIVQTTSGEIKILAGEITSC